MMIGFLWFFLRSVKVTFRRGDTLHPDVFTMCRVLPLHAFRLCTLRFGIGLELDSVWNWIRIGFGPWRSADTRNLFLSFPSVSFSFSEPLFPGFFLGFFPGFFPGFFSRFFSRFLWRFFLHKHPSFLPPPPPRILFPENLYPRILALVARD